MMKMFSFGKIFLRLASFGYTKLFQKDNLNANFCGGEANVVVSLANFYLQLEFLTVIPNNDVESGKLNKSGYEYVVKEIYERFNCNKVAITLRENINTSHNG